jgi:EmrB/QacA subfamily drug resistance transporter
MGNVMTRGAKVLAITSVSVFLVSLDSSITNVAFRDIVTDYGEQNRSLLSWIFSAYNIAYAAGLLVAGRFADVFGRKKSFMRGLAIFTVGSVACALAPTAGLLVAARVVQALGGAILTPASIALVLPEFPVEKRSAALGIWGAVGGLAAAIGPIAGGVLVDTFGWRSLFFINLPLCAAAIAVSARVLHESTDPTAQRRVDMTAAVTVTAGVALVVFGIVESEKWGWTSTGVLGSFAGAAILLAVFVRRCSGAESPLLDLSLLRLPFVVAANVAGFIFSLGFFAMFFTNTQWLQQVWGYSTSGSGLAFIPGPLTAAVLAAPAGRLAQQWGHQKVIAVGATLLGGGTLILNLTIPDTPAYWSNYFPLMLLTGAGVGLCISTISSAGNAYLPQTRFAMGSALATTTRMVGAAVGVALVTAMLGPTLEQLFRGRGQSEATGTRFDIASVDLDAFHRSWWLITAAMAVAAIAMMALFRRPTEAQMATAGATVPAGVD